MHALATPRHRPRERPDLPAVQVDLVAAATADVPRDPVPRPLTPLDQPVAVATRPEWYQSHPVGLQWNSKTGMTEPSSFTTSSLCNRRNPPSVQSHPPLPYRPWQL